MGLPINVFRNPEGDFTGGGVSSKFTTLTVVNFDCLRLVPAVLDHRGLWVPARGRLCMGGNFGFTSDTRFVEKCAELLERYFYGAVAIHDRLEFEGD